MKAVTQVMTAIIIIAIALSLITVLWIFISEYYTSLTSSGEETLGESLATISSCMKIESVSGNKLYLRNCGEGVLTEDTLEVYLDDEPLNIAHLDKTFGNTNVGVSSISAYYGETHVVRFDLPEAGSIKKITAYVSGNWGNPATIHAGIYDDNNGNPNNLKGKTSDTIVPNTLGWYDFVFSTPLSLPAGTYHIGLYSYVNDFVWYYNVGSTNQYHYYVWSDFPNQWSGGRTQNWEMSIYATYVQDNLIINEDEVGSVSLSGLWNLPTGQHLLKVTNPKTATELAVEAVLPDSVVLALDFDEGEGNKVYDKSGYGNDGTIFENPSWVDGRFGNALYFNRNGYVDISHSSSLDISGNEITLELWFKSHQGSADYYLCKGTYEIENSNAPNVWISASNTTDYEGRAFIGSHLFGTWYNVIGVINTTHIKIYLDGIERDSDIWLGNIKSGSQNLQINSCMSADRANVTIDNVRIYNKALTPDETIVLRPVTYD